MDSFELGVVKRIFTFLHLVVYLRWAISMEGKISRKNNVHHDTETPTIALLAIVAT